MVGLGKGHRRQALLAICPGTEGVAAAVVRRESGVPPTLDFCTFLPGALPADQLQSIHRIVKSRGWGKLECTSALDMNAYNLLLVETPDVPPAELRAAIRWRVKDFIEFPIDEAAVDYFELPAQKNAGSAPMLYVVVARAPLVKQRVDGLLDAGVRLTTIDIPELCLRNLAALLPEDAGGTAFIYLARDYGLITLTRQGTLYVSRRLQTGTALLWEQNVDRVTPEIEGWLDAIVIEVQRSIDYYESHFTTPPIAGLVIAPLGRELSGMTEYLSGQLGLPCRVLDLSAMIDAREPVSTEVQTQCLPAIAAALRDED